MDDLLKALLGVACAVLIYVATKFALGPVHDLRKAIASVRSTLSLHAATIHTPIGRTRETSDAAANELKKCSSELQARLHSVPMYGLFSTIRLVPTHEALEDAVKWLRALATYVHEEGDAACRSLDIISKLVARIERQLGLRPTQ